MGEIADMMLNGILCEMCGVFLNEEPRGYPCRCDYCAAYSFLQNFRTRKVFKTRDSDEFIARTIDILNSYIDDVLPKAGYYKYRDDVVENCIVRLEEVRDEITAVFNDEDGV